MTDTTPKSEGKKYQLVKIAIELNISKEHIVDYLKKKGFDVSKPLLMKVDEETYQDILKTFRKDKELADKYHKKVEDFKKKTQEKEAEKKQKAEEKKVEKADETIKKVAEKEKQIPEVVTEVAAAKPEEKKEEIIQPEEPKTTVIEAEQKAEKTPPAEVIEKTKQAAEVKEKAVVPEAPVLEAKPEPKVEETAQTIETKAPVEQKVEEVQPQPAELKTTAEEPKVEEIKPPAVEEAIDEQKMKAATSAEEQEKEEEHAVTSLKEIIEKRKELVVKGKIDLDEVSEVVEHKVETKEKPPVKEKAKEKEKEREVEKEKEREKEKAEEKEPKKKKEKKPKKKRLREEIKKKKQAEEEISEKGKKLKKVKSKVIDEKEIDEAIRRTFESMDVGSYKTSFKKKKKKEKQEQLKQQQEEVEKQKSILKVTEFISVNELSKLMNVPVSEVIAKCMSLGLMVSINQRLNLETITLVADEFGYTVELQTEFVSDELIDTPDNPEDLKPRPPIVTIMGHVDHGKTSLLDYIRKSQIVAGEAGGITQHIGAYKVTLANGKEITFLDTPGHEAFTAMRARGAQVTDIVVLVVAADDSVMPQTVEAINHAQAAGVPIIVAVNKIDKPGVNIDRIYKQLSERNILVEKWGGKYQSAEISAKYGKNIDDLLDKILLEAELLNLRANPNRMARGILIEVKLDKGKGIVGTVLVQKGTLKVGDPFVAGIVSGRVRAMYDERENRLSKAGPATPVQVIGFNEMPQAGDELIVVESDKLAHQISLQRTQIKRAQDRSMVRHITLDEISRQIKIGGVKDLYIIVKGDVDGSVEAISDALLKLSTEEVRVQIIHKGVGAIVEADVLLAEASQAIIIGFQVRPNLNAKKLAEAENVEIRLYNIIYDVINDVKSAIEGMLSPEVSEITTATVEVRDVIKISKVGTVAGCYVTDGTIHRNDKVRIIRDGIVIYDGAIETLKRFKDDVREVVAGYECGIKIENFNDIKVGDVIEGYKLTEKKRKLDYVSKN